MTAKEAVRIAIEHVRDLFESEKLSNLGLEEVEYEDNDHSWTVTVGFSRPWDFPPSPFAAVLSNQMRPERRDYKTVRIRESDSKVISVKNRPVDVVR